MPYFLIDKPINSSINQLPHIDLLITLMQKFKCQDFSRPDFIHSDVLKLKDK